MKARALFFLGYLWALPLTLTGLLLALVTLSPPMFNVDGCVFFKAGVGLRWFHDRFAVWAFTWGGTCFWAPDAPTRPDVVAHELVHFRQARQWGPLFPLAYLLASANAHFSEGHAYHDNHFEIEARKEAGR